MGDGIDKNISDAFEKAGAGRNSSITEYGSFRLLVVAEQLRKLLKDESFDPSLF